METREFDTREQAFEAAKKALGCEVTLDDADQGKPGWYPIYRGENGWICDLNCRFEVNFNSEMKSECFWIKQKFTEGEVKHLLVQAWLDLQGIEEVVHTISHNIADDDLRNTLYSILDAKKAAAKAMVERFIPAELLK